MKLVIAFFALFFSASGAWAEDGEPDEAPAAEQPLAADDGDPPTAVAPPDDSAAAASTGGGEPPAEAPPTQSDSTAEPSENAAAGAGAASELASEQAGSAQPQASIDEADEEAPIDPALMSMGAWEAPACAATSPDVAENASEADIAAAEAKAKANQATCVAQIRALVGKARAKVLPKIEHKIATKQASNLGRISAILFFVSLGGILFLLMPLFLSRKYPGRASVLFKYSALAGFLFFLAINLFSGVMMTMRTIQGATASATNPQVRVASATLNMLDEKAPDIAPVWDAAQGLLAGASANPEQSMLATMMENAQQLGPKFAVFLKIKRAMSAVDWAFALIPFILLGLTMLVFFKTAKPTLIAIAKLPGQAAASPHAGMGKQVAATTLRAVWAEFKTMLCIAGILTALTLLAGTIMALVLVPAIEVIFAYFVLALVYVQNVANASAAAIMIGLVGGALFLVLNIAVFILASAFFMGKAQKIFQQKFREGVPLARHKKFWIWGTASVALLMALPLIYIKLFLSVNGDIAGAIMGESGRFKATLALSPVIFIASFALFFFLARGFKALGFLKKYDVAAAKAAPAYANAVVPTQAAYVGPSLVAANVTAPTPPEAAYGYSSSTASWTAPPSPQHVPPPAHYVDPASVAKTAPPALFSPAPVTPADVLARAARGTDTPFGDAPTLQSPVPPVVRATTAPPLPPRPTVQRSATVPPPPPLPKDE